ncbi:MAG: hypothetical protein MUE85_03545 [Microscillaceae bacterium]|jgi:hypothetical protein|nr:hypothetical protein [Microscillaceae bacterium]
MKKFIKNTVLVFILSFSFCELAMPQSSSEAQPYSGLFLYMGSHAVRTESSFLELSYIDESPAPDRLTTTKNIEAGSRGFGFNLGLEFGNYKGAHVELSLGGAYGKAKRALFELGVGRNFSMGEKFVVRPVVTLSMGAARFPIGSMRNNTGYIEVNGTEFYAETISVSLREYQFGLRPRVDFLYRVTDRITARANVGYYLKVFDNAPYLHFSGVNENAGEDDDVVTAREKISESNVNLIINDAENQRDLPVKFGGLSFNLGVGYSFGRKR